MDNFEDNPYRRSPRSNSVFGNAFSSDLYRQCSEELSAEISQKEAPSKRNLTIQNRELIGVLFSLSAGKMGEMFPLYIGRNIIGSNPECDVCLRETSVSARHAILLIRKMTDAEGEECLTVSVSDANSSYGTQLNGELLGYEKTECYHGDILAFGQGYKLKIVLFGLDSRLSVAPIFDRLPELEAKPEEQPGNEQTAPSEPQSADGQDMKTQVLKGAAPQQVLVPEGGQAAAPDFYRRKPSKDGDHYNNKTIIL